MRGGLRASTQLMWYELALGRWILGSFLVYGTLEPGAMWLMQGSNPPHWCVGRERGAYLMVLVRGVA